MTDPTSSAPVVDGLDDLYAESEHWQVNDGGETIHAKRLPGRWRRIKWWAASVWLIFFLGPYVRWNGGQAVLFDIPNRQYHLFGATVLPQDFWMLSLLLLFFAILLAVATALAGRVYCGFFCFQTVWTDIFTLIEEWLEGNPRERRLLERAPWTPRKLGIKSVKHLLWMLIGFATGWSFVAWFYGVFPLWRDFFTAQANGAVYAFVALFTVGTYVLAGWLREQVCFWLCPYARIQGVMLDRTTLVPAYDLLRGEPRGRLHKGADARSDAGLDAGAQKQGDCIDCNQCVAVCPTGIDIRAGQQEGCITCALCIDACDQVMDKVNRPRGLIRYASLDEIEGRGAKALLKRVRVWVYFAILALSLVGIVYGFSTLTNIELKVLHERSPLFVQLSDGSIQNKYTLKVLNKANDDLTAEVAVRADVPIEVKGIEHRLRIKHGEVTPMIVFVRIEPEHLTGETIPIFFSARATLANGTEATAERESAFFAERR
ncbi:MULTISPECIES: cytochrome c oxidase accessory protein CcoG [Thiorhodovibrio]|uniref:cytochrome c oxidase accessory protein CcoG n=1 Tax=Thiorhodovibrio TaxID=61593 RepID=UPI0019116CBD|nr:MULTISPECIES: cytochrome c oxidase accessory protein CcoG [Thiorhodovibrio]MBK5967432.1 cytochrome c oxidase accessory protein CcoG [Thiorhodovibrio winogradskyi]WPL12558.1 cytochrome c oxidase accessory protein CcoG [Thiorhodovibrio litoralis]